MVWFTVHSVRTMMVKSKVPEDVSAEILTVIAKHRYIVFQVLPHPLGSGPEVWRDILVGKRAKGESVSSRQVHNSTTPPGTV